VNDASALEQLGSAFGVDGTWIHQTLVKAVEVLVVVLVAIWLAGWIDRRIRRALMRSGLISSEVAVLISRAAGIGIYALSATLVLAILGVNWAALAAVLGAATIGLSLALQDVGRSFVNGVYLLVERPFRIGDRIRIGLTEGEVEDIGVRVTTLRTDTGERIIVPNTVVFSSTIENASLGRVGRETYGVKGIQRSIAEIDDAVMEAFSGTSYLDHQPPTVDIVESRPDGTDIDVTIACAAGQRIGDDVLARLREQFPEATINAKPAAGAS
jgi:small-conductance mechanosensitive channel